MKQMPGVRRPTEETCTTRPGAVVHSSDSTSKEIVLAVTTDSSGAVHHWTLTAIGPALSAALSAHQCFLVATRSAVPDQGTQTLQEQLFAFQGGVAFADWFMTANVAANRVGTALILKYGPASVAQLVGQLSSWTSAATFNSDPVSAQGVLRSALRAIAMNASSTDARLAALYEPVWQRLNNPSWNGLLVLQPDVVTLPAIVAGIVNAGPAGVLQALALGVEFTNVTIGGPTGPTLVGSAPFALIDFENRPCAVAEAGDYRFEVFNIRAQFENAALTSLSAPAVLEINTSPAARVTV